MFDMNAFGAAIAVSHLFEKKNTQCNYEEMTSYEKERNGCICNESKKCKKETKRFNLYSLMLKPIFFEIRKDRFNETN